MVADGSTNALPLRVLPRKPPPPGVRKVAEALEERLDALVEQTLHAILEEVPVYHERGETVATDTRRAAAYVYATFIEILRSGAPPSTVVAGSLSDVGADRALQGIPLGDLLQGFRISARTAANMLTSLAVDKDLDRDACLWVAETLVIWIDVVSNLAAGSYSQTQVRIVREDEERLRDFLLDLLHGAVAGEEALERADAVGWDPATAYWVGVFARADADCTREDQDAFTDAVQRCYALRTRGTVVVAVPVPTAADVAAVETAAIGVADHLDLLSGVGEPGSGIAGVRRAYVEAAEAATIAVALDERLVRFDTAVLDRILRRDLELLEELVQRTIGPLEDYDRSRSTDLVATLEAYFRKGESPTRTADVLHTHAQTVRYRLGRIREISGLALDDPDGRLHLLLGLRGRRLLRHNHHHRE